MLLLLLSFLTEYIISSAALAMRENREAARMDRKAYLKMPTPRLTTTTVAPQGSALLPRSTSQVLTCDPACCDSNFGPQSPAKRKRNQFGSVTVVEATVSTNTFRTVRTFPDSFAIAGISRTFFLAVGLRSRFSRFFPDFLRWLSMKQGVDARGIA